MVSLYEPEGHYILQPDFYGQVQFVFFMKFAILIDVQTNFFFNS